MDNDTKYYSNKLLEYINNQNQSYFILNIMCSDVLIEPDLITNITEYKQELHGELCNFLCLHSTEITMENLSNLIGLVILYQYPSRFSVDYHMRFVRIKQINKEDNTIVLDSINNEYCPTSIEKINDLKRRSSAYRIWMPARLYIDKIDRD